MNFPTVLSGGIGVKSKDRERRVRNGSAGCCNDVVCSLQRDVLCNIISKVLPKGCLMNRRE